MQKELKEKVLVFLETAKFTSNELEKMQIERHNNFKHYETCGLHLIEEQEWDDYYNNIFNQILELAKLNEQKASN
jgi:hypothetical protein